MATRAQIERLAQRIDALTIRLAPPDPPPECWVVDGDRAYQRNNPEHVVSVAEMEARPYPRIVRVIVDPAAIESAA